MELWEKQLEQDLNWRESELASFKVLVVDASPGTVREQALLRALWMMLYAHYEGFCKFAWDTFIDHLQGSRALRCDCVESIAIFSLTKIFKDLRNYDPRMIWEFCTTDFQKKMGSQISFDIPLETKSNLWPELCKDNCNALNLPYTAIDRHHHKLRTLVSRRNDIAHGKQMTIHSLQEYQKYEDAAFEVMYEITLGIVECLSDQSYLLPTTLQSKI